MNEQDYVNMWVKQTEDRIKALRMMVQANTGSHMFDTLASLHSQEKKRLNELKRRLRVLEL